MVNTTAVIMMITDLYFVALWVIGNSSKWYTVIGCVTDECDYNIRNLNENSATTAGPLQVKLLCGADMLESFAVPGLWKEEDVSVTIITSM